MKLLNKSLMSALAIVSLLGLAACGEKKEEGAASGTTGTTEQPAAGTTGTTTGTTNP